MSTWLKLLTLELDSINESDIIEPVCTPQKDDHPVGEMSDAARRLFTLARLLEKDAKQCQLDANFCGDKTIRLELEARGYELAAKSEATQALMWISIRDEFKVWHESVGVRSSFKVVVSPNADNDIPPFLKKLLGG